ncbi:hypothetical protein PGB90_002787 [Kerria lacca]
MKPVSNFLGIKWKIRNTENINLEKNAIFVSNHQSMYDIVGMMYLWQMRSIKCVTIAKNELFWFWPVGLLMWLGGIVFIKRSGSVRTQKYINETAKQVFKNKHNLWFYVEGTRNKHPKKLLPFKKGAFRLAIEHQVPIIPIMYSPYYFINWKEKRFDSGTMIIDVLKPIQTTDFTMQNLDDLIDKTYETIHKLLAFSIIGIFTLLRYDADLQTTIRCYFNYWFLGISALLISLLILPVAVFRPWNVKNILLGAYFTNPLSQLVGIQWEIRNTQNMISDSESAVIVSNHQTALDILGMLYLVNQLNIRCTAVGRKLIFWIWPFGLILWLSGIVFISRKPNFQKTHRQMNEAAQLIEQQQVKIWIFPEGTRNANSEFLLPFKKGAFRLAIKNQIPIIPIVFSPYYFVNWQQKRFESGKMVMEILQPIKTDGYSYKDLDSLVEKTYSIISKTNKKLHAETTNY